jgi:hypothetical protein
MKWFMKMVHEMGSTGRNIHMIRILSGQSWNEQCYERHQHDVPYLGVLLVRARSYIIVSIMWQCI